VPVNEMNVGTNKNDNGCMKRDFLDVLIRINFILHTRMSVTIETKRTRWSTERQASECYSIHCSTQSQALTCEDTVITIWLPTERRGRVVNTPASYSGGPGFRSGPGDLLP
jgi:hypothetical protein